jgi:hypothetical protein
MISLINKDEKIFPLVAGVLEEEGISVRFGHSLHDVNGEADFEQVAIIKPDLYYNTRDFATPPKSVDGLVVVSGEGGFHFYVAELKSSKLRNIRKKDIEEKFNTIFDRFLCDDFSHIFMGDYHLKKLNLWLVCDPLGFHKLGEDREETIRRANASQKLRGLLADVAIGLRVYEFKGRAAMIKPMLSPPMIERDSYHDVLI